MNCTQTPGDGWHGPTGGPGDPDGPGGPNGEAPLTSVVPEPATWMMLILGFGVLGSVLRAQRRKAQVLA